MVDAQQRGDARGLRESAEGRPSWRYGRNRWTAPAPAVEQQEVIKLLPLRPPAGQNSGCLGPSKSPAREEGPAQPAVNPARKWVLSTGPAAGTWRKAPRNGCCWWWPRRAVDRSHRAAQGNSRWTGKTIREWAEAPWGGAEGDMYG